LKNHTIIHTETDIAEFSTQALSDRDLLPIAVSGTQLPGGMEPLVREMLLMMGEDPDREGLQRTPERVARMYQELLSGYQVDLSALVNQAIFDSDTRRMVLVANINFYSLCEHHLLPFFGQVHVAYIPDGKIIGLSKIPRLVEMFARRLQVQERMTQQIADTLQDILHPLGTAVLVEGAHMCSMMRGVKKSDARMLTSAMLGAFENPEIRSDFYNQVALLKKENT
jgi:GTP cyclohydrolase I